MGDEGKVGGRAIVLRSSATIVGMNWYDVAGLATVFSGTVPIAGKVCLEWLSFNGGAIGTYLKLCWLQLAIASEVPVFQSDLDAGEQVFPHMSSVVGAESRLSFRIAYYPEVFRLGMGISMNGRRFVAGFYNGGANAASVQMTLGLTRVVGGEVGSGVQFLSGERLEWR